MADSRAQQTDTPQQQTLQLHLAGQPALSGGPLGPQGWALPPLDAALLALVAVDGPLPRQRVAAWLWPEAPPEGARANLRQRLRRLRLRCGGLPLATGTGRLQLAPAVQLADAGTAEPAQALRPLPWLGHHQHAHSPRLQAWVQQQRAGWAARQRAQLAQALVAAARQGRPDEAVRLVERFVHDAPQDEGLHRQLMRLHQARGDGAAVQRSFEHCCACLRRHRGSLPQPATVRLHQQLMQPGMARPGALEPLATALLCLAAVAGDALSVSAAAQVTGRNALQLLSPWLALQRQGWFGLQGPVPAQA